MSNGVVHGGGVVGDNGGGGVGHGGSGVNNGGGGGVGDNGGGVDDGHDGLADGVNVAVLVDVLGEPLEGQGSQPAAGGDEVSEGGGEGAGGGTGVDVRVGGGGEDAAQDGTQANLKENHI